MAGLAKPVLAVADDNPGTVAELEAALTRRFGADYQVVASTDPGAVLSAVRAVPAHVSRFQTDGIAAEGLRTAGVVAG